MLPVVERNTSRFFVPRRPLEHIYDMDGFAGNYGHESGSLHQLMGELIRLQGRKKERIGEYFFFQFTSLLNDIIIEGCHLISYVFFDVHELGVNVCKYIKVAHRYRSSLCKGVRL